jgi:hypothetical protein
MIAGRFCVLDVETRLSDDAAHRVGRNPPPTVQRVALQEVHTVATLVFDRTEDGGFGGFELACAELGMSGEAGLLIDVATRLDAEHDYGATLVTFNGSHDMSVLRRRAGRHWLFDRFQCSQWRRPGTERHLDMMQLNGYGGSRYPNLIDACAGFGFDAWPPVPVLKRHGAPSGGDKCVLDVVATAMLLFFELAFREGSPIPVAHGWSGLSEALRPLLHDWPHIAPILNHPAAAEGAALASLYGRRRSTHN